MPALLRTLLLAVTLLSSSAYAASAKASEESIREVLRIVDAKKVIDMAFAQVDGMMKESMLRSVGGAKPTPEQEALMEKFRVKTMDMMKEEMSWEKLEPLYIQIYQKTLTQEEIDGMIVFYKSPAGEAVIKKLPLIMQESMGLMQNIMGTMMPKIQSLVQESAREAQALKKK